MPDKITPWDFFGRFKMISPEEARERISKNLHVCWEEGCFNHYYPAFDPGGKYHHHIADKLLPNGEYARDGRMPDPPPPPAGVVIAQGEPCVTPAQILFALLHTGVERTDPRWRQPITAAGSIIDLFGGPAPAPSQPGLDSTL